MLGFGKKQRIFWGMPRGCVTSLWRFFRKKNDLGYNQQLEWYFSKGCAATTVHVGKKVSSQQMPVMTPTLRKKFQKIFWSVLGGAMGEKVQIMGVFLSFSSLSVHWCLSTEGRGLKITSAHISYNILPSFKKKFQGEKKLWTFFSNVLAGKK